MRFRTHPHPDTPAPLTFAALGDFGVGIRRLTAGGRRQRTIAQALERAVEARDIRLVLTTGDNIYLGDPEAKGGSGDEDDDWFFTYYQPYRYVIDHVPVYPAAGNHDAEQEASDDRQQLADNFFLEERFTDEVPGRDVSLDPGLFCSAATARTSSSSASTRPLRPRTASGSSTTRGTPPSSMRRSRPQRPPPQHVRAGASPSRITRHTAPARTIRTREMVERLVPRFERAGVRVVLSGHEHNFQLAVTNGICY